MLDTIDYPLPGVQGLLLQFWRQLKIELAGGDEEARAWLDTTDFDAKFFMTLDVLGIPWIDPARHDVADPDAFRAKLLSTFWRPRVAA